MSSAERSLARGLPVFHLRLGGCGGCADVVDALLRDRFKGRPPLVECSSPRHAALVIVSGMWNEGLSLSALEVLAQAPDGRRILVVGDCALARGLLAESMGDVEAVADHIDAQGEVNGCPPALSALAEGVKDVTR